MLIICELFLYYCPYFSVNLNGYKMKSVFFIKDHSCIGLHYFRACRNLEVFQYDLTPLLCTKKNRCPKRINSMSEIT